MKLFQKWTGLGLAILMLAALLIPASAADTVTAAEEMQASYYQTLESADGVKLTGTPSLTIMKYVHTEGDATTPDTSKPIEGVVFQYAKVGGLYQLTLPNHGTAMAYGVAKTFATALGLDADDADYQDNDRYYFADGDVLQNAVRTKTKDDVSSFATSDTTTDVDGKATTTLSGYGLYLVVESNVTNAKVNGESIAVTQTQAPFLVALPTLGTDNHWDETITANVKNSADTATVEKKIVVGTDETKTDGTEQVADTDITTIGDTVHFRLKGTVPAIPSTSTQKIEKYVLTDQISKGLDPVVDVGTVKIDGVRVVGDAITLGTDDYTVSALADISAAGEYQGGNSFTITFTTAGLEKLTQLAKSVNTTKEVYFYYSATVNEDAVIGPGTGNSGNPNEVMLTYQVTGSQELDTGWDKVTEFTFEIDVTKEFEGTAPGDARAVTFKLYSSPDGGTTKNYYKFSNAAAAGTYSGIGAATGAGDATELKLDSNNKISIKGLDEGTYYLEETATVAGYNVLKEPVVITITAETGTNNYVAPTTDTTYVGTFTEDTGDTGAVSVTVINTQGFQLPATGGAGIWMFVIGGIAVIAVGCVYFLATKKKKS